LLIKESYLLSKNVLGLGVHPFKTLREIQREKDRSQQLLLWGLPGYVLVIGLMVVWLGRRLWGQTDEWGWPAKITGTAFLLWAAMVGGYLSYWWFRVWRSRL